MQDRCQRRASINALHSRGLASLAMPPCTGQRRSRHPTRLPKATIIVTVFSRVVLGFFVDLEKVARDHAVVDGPVALRQAALGISLPWAQCFFFFHMARHLQWLWFGQLSRPSLRLSRILQDQIQGAAALMLRGQEEPTPGTTTLMSAKRDTLARSGNRCGTPSQRLGKLLHVRLRVVVEFFESVLHSRMWYHLWHSLRPVRFAKSAALWVQALGVHGQRREWFRTDPLDDHQFSSMRRNHRKDSTYGGRRPAWMDVRFSKFLLLFCCSWIVCS